MKKRLFLIALTVLLLCAFVACASEPPPEVDEWDNWIVGGEAPWWTVPGARSGTGADWLAHMMNLSFSAPDALLPVAEEMAITHYISFIGIGAWGHYALPLIAAAAEGDSDIQDRIVEALTNRILTMFNEDAALAAGYMVIFSDRRLVFDPVTRDIFEQLQTRLGENRPGAVGLFADALSPYPALSDVHAVLSAREDGAVGGLLRAEDLYMFRQDPAAFLEAAYRADIMEDLVELATYIAITRFADPALYVHYRALLDHLEEQDLSDGAANLFIVFDIQIEFSYAEWRSVFG